MRTARYHPDIEMWKRVGVPGDRGFPGNIVKDYGELPVDDHTLVIDIGANIGAATIHFARVAKHVIAVEAMPENMQLLAANTALFGNVTNIWGLVSAMGEPGICYWDPDRPDCSSIFPSRSYMPDLRMTAVAVPGVGFEALLELGYRHLGVGERLVVKCDIEGAEHDLPWSVLDGRCAGVAIEIHRFDAEMARKAAETVSALTGVLGPPTRPPKATGTSVALWR